jgi:hypothetical protein
MSIAGNPPATEAKLTRSERVIAKCFFKSILAIALLLRLAIVWSVIERYPKGWFFRSQGELGFLAQSLVAGHGLSSPFGGSTGPTAFLAPGYPVIVAGIFYLFGSFTPRSAIAIMLLQTAFSLATIYLIMWVGRRQFGAAAANIAGLFWAVGVPFVWMPAVFWDTSLSILLLTGAFALALVCSRTPGILMWGLFGAYGAIALLVNPSLALMLVALFLWTAFQGSRRHVLGPLVGSVVLLILFASWPIRNARVLHTFIPLRSNLGFELWKGNRPGSDTVDDSALYPVFNRGEYADYAHKGELIYMHDKTVLAERYIRTHPSVFLRLSARRFVVYWTGAAGPDPSFLLAAHEVLTTCLAGLGLLFLLRAGRMREALLFALPLLLFPLPYYITHAELRFRILLEPITTLLAAYAVVRLAAAFNRPANPDPLPAEVSSL